MSIWDELDKEMSTDNRLGNHDFVVDSVNDGEWEPGRAYRELSGRLVTADNFDIRQRFNVTPPDEVVAEQIKHWDRKTKQSVNLSHQNDVVLEKEYGVKLSQVKPGDTFRVRTDYQTKDGKKYIRIVNFLPKTASLSANGGSTEKIPF